MPQLDDDSAAAEAPASEAVPHAPEKSGLLRWSPGDIKLLVITLVGTVTANLITLIMVGLAIYLVRQGLNSKGDIDSSAYLQFAALGCLLIFTSSMIWWARSRKPRTIGLEKLIYFGLAIVLSLLLLVGYAARIK